MLDIFKRRRTIIMDEKDVTKVLRIVNEHVKITCDQGLFVEHCGWEEAPERWFILFYSINRQWEKILEEIRVINSVEVE